MVSVWLRRTMRDCSRKRRVKTFSVYGDTMPGPRTEKAARLPGKDAYGSSKLEAEQLVQQYQQQGFPASIQSGENNLSQVCWVCRNSS
jgi:nucleoside-diphosphate-sugar epimerase